MNSVAGDQHSETSSVHNTASSSSVSISSSSTSDATTHSTTARGDVPPTSGQRRLPDTPESLDQASSVAGITTNPLFKSLTSDEDDDDDDDGEDCYVNGPRDALQEGLLGLIRPTVETLDRSVRQTRVSQTQLKTEIEALNRDLLAIRQASGSEDPFPQLDVAVEKLTQAKRRVVVVANLLQGAQDRLNRVHQSCLKETTRSRGQLETATRNQ
eukprot:TCALIF_09296-PA protein Name:"Similar to SNAPIN SNARE-associated protein Snapin (Homo sapiens)" AED:0.02 eAED:0.02 QI:417/1/1/1/1/0.83/6/3023/212